MTKNMVKKAVDVVLLPTEMMTEVAIGANAELVKKFGEKIVLNKENCLPHISLAMGCINDADIASVEEILWSIAKQFTLGQLNVVGISVTGSSAGEKVSAFEIEKTEELRSLHKNVMEKLSPYFSTDVTEDMIYDGAGAGESTLLWIKNYPEESSFENFSPHITIGYGEVAGGVSFPIKFAVSKLALCHLGNHCTCRQVLVSVELEKA